MNWTIISADAAETAESGSFDPAQNLSNPPDQDQTATLCHSPPAAAAAATMVPPEHAPTTSPAPDETITQPER